MRPAAFLAFCLLANPAMAFDSPQSLQDAFMDALRANDAQGLSECYAADARSFPVDDMVGVGPDFVRESWKGFFERYNVIDVTVSDVHTEESGDMAASWGQFTMTVEPTGGGEPVVMQGRFTDVARRVEGDWLYIADHASVPLPAAGE